MNKFSMALGGLASMFSFSCGGLTTVAPAERASTFAQAASQTPGLMVLADAHDPVAARPVSRLVVGTAGRLLEGVAPCFADLYPCEEYDFSLPQEGPIEVEVTWEGAPRALLVQLYWTGEGLAHEDVAPREGPSRIYFRRPRMEAASYTLRVVNLEPTRRTPFALTLGY